MLALNPDLIIRILISLAFGAIIGFERELRETSAGLRTHSLVCLGAAIFTMVSLIISGPNVDVSRIAGQVVVGIGFIGGGVIFKSKDRVYGLTTAASLWVAAALGLLAGLGEFVLGIFSLCTALVILVGGRYIEQRMFHKKKVY